MISALLAAVLVDLAGDGSRRARAHELRGRLGLRPADGPAPSYIDRLRLVHDKLGAAPALMVQAWLQGFTTPHEVTPDDEVPLLRLFGVDLPPLSEMHLVQVPRALLWVPPGMTPERARYLPWLAAALTPPSIETAVLILEDQLSEANAATFNPHRDLTRIRERVAEEGPRGQLTFVERDMPPDEVAMRVRVRAWSETIGTARNFASTQVARDRKLAALDDDALRPIIDQMTGTDLLDFLAATHPRRWLWHPDGRPRGLEEVLYAAAAWHDEQACRAHLSGPVTTTGQTIEARWPDGWHLARLTTPDDLRLETRALGHCIGGGGYDQRLRDPRFRYLSLRDPAGHPRVTLELYSHTPGVTSVLQVRGRRNLAPDGATLFPALRALAKVTGPDRVGTWPPHAIENLTWEAATDLASSGCVSNGDLDAMLGYHLFRRVATEDPRWLKFLDGMLYRDFKSGLSTCLEVTAEANQPMFFIVAYFSGHYIYRVRVSLPADMLVLRRAALRAADAMASFVSRPDLVTPSPPALPTDEHLRHQQEFIVKMVDALERQPDGDVVGSHEWVTDEGEAEPTPEAFQIEVDRQLSAWRALR